MVDTPARPQQKLATATTQMAVEDVLAVLSEENRALYDALTLSRRRVANMREVATAMAGQLDIDALLNIIISKVSTLCDCERATLFVVDSDRRQLWSRVIEGSEVIRMPMGSGIVGAVARSGVPINLAEAYADPRFDPSFDRRSGYVTRALLACPIVGANGEVAGVVEALNKRDGLGFSVEDERMLEAICAEVSVALKNALLFDDLKQAHTALTQRVRELDLLVEVDRLLLASDSAADLVHTVTQRALSLLEADVAVVALIDPRSGRVKSHARDVDGRTFKSERASAQDCGPGRALLFGDGPLDPAGIAAIVDGAPSVGPMLALPFLAAPTAASDGALIVGRRPGGDAFGNDHARVLTLLAGRVAAALASVRARERSKNEAQLEALGSMLAGIVHDLRTPMTVISGYVQLMAMEDDPVERQANAEVVMKSCDHMTSMIKELLGFVRGESELLLRKTYLEPLLQEVEDNLSKLCEGTDIRVLVTLRYLGAVRVDDTKLKRALVNLGKNAIEAMGQQGRLSIQVEQVSDQFEIVVADTGPGLSPEVESRLFERFVTHGKRDGTGLGLSLVKKIVTDHGGNIRVDNKPGNGVTFRLRLPL